MSLPYSRFRSEGLCLLRFQHGSEKQFWVPSHSRFCLRALTSFENNTQMRIFLFGKEIMGNYGKLCCAQPIRLGGVSVSISYVRPSGFLHESERHGLAVRTARTVSTNGSDSTSEPMRREERADVLHGRNRRAARRNFILT